MPIFSHTISCTPLKKGETLTLYQPTSSLRQHSIAMRPPPILSILTWLFLYPSVGAALLLWRLSTPPTSALAVRQDPNDSIPHAGPMSTRSDGLTTSASDEGHTRRGRNGRPKPKKKIFPVPVALAIIMFGGLGLLLAIGGLYYLHTRRKQKKAAALASSAAG